MKDLFGENEGEKIEMRTRLYTSTKKEKTRRKTELTDIDDIDLWRRANGVYELCQCMMSKPERGKSYHILTGGNVDLLSHLLWIMLHWPKIKRLFLSCWAISAADIMLLARKLEAKEISGLEILLGDIFETKYKMEWAKLMEMYNAGVITDIYKSTIHSKVMLIEAEDGTKLVVESSANCNMNPRIEQSCITISEKLFDFYDVYLHEVLNDAEAKYTARETMKLMNDETDKIDNDERAALLRENGVGDEMGEPEEHRIRLSWSEGMRMMTTRKQRELRVVAFDGMLRMMKTAFELGYDVVIDECNLNGFEWGIIITRAQNCHAKVEWHTMNTPLEECKRRAKAAGANISDIEFDNLACRWEVWLKQKG